MSNLPHLENPDDYESETKALPDSFHLFKRPKKTSKHAMNLSTVRFILPNGHSEDVPAGEQIIIGRQAGNDNEVNFDLSVIYGPDSGISRTHAVMQISTDSVSIRDLDSRNGTFLNGQELYPHRDYTVNDGDELRVGKVKMRVIFL
jgi:pSer/pThr/pTyr-binding forkhead associated (FHA) protein